MATLGIVVSLIRYSVRTSGVEAPSSRAVVEELWEGPDEGRGDVTDADVRER
jgi:hypothetical protein